MSSALRLVALVVAVLGWLGAPALAQAPAARVIEVQTSARGATPEAAVRAAVLDAARRVNGSATALDMKVRQRFEDSLRDLDLALSAPGVTVASMQSDIAIASRGLVERLRVLSERSLPDGTFDATILAGVAIFEAKLSSRKTIAVASFRPGRADYRFGPLAVPSSEILRRLTDATIERLVQSNTVTVLDRSFVEDIGREKNFLETFSRNTDELARFGRMLGADYLLVGNMEYAGLDVINQVVEASGYRFSRASAGMQVTARLVETETGVIAWAGTIESGFGNSELERMFPGSEPEPSATAAALVGRVADELATAVVESIAPIKVALVEGDAIWLNRGSGRLQLGHRLMIRGGGQQVVDPDTGEALGMAERTIAVVEVVATDPRKSQARVLEGDPAAIRIGQIARPIARP